MRNDDYHRNKAFLVALILERDHGDLDTRAEKYRALAARVGVSGETIRKIGEGHHCGRKTARRLEQLARPPRAPKPSDSFRLYTTFETEAERDLVRDTLPPDERRNWLLFAAGQETP